MILILLLSFLSFNSFAIDDELHSAILKFGKKNSITTIHCKTEELTDGKTTLLFNHYEIIIHRNRRGTFKNAYMNATEIYGHKSVEQALASGIELAEGKADFMNISSPKNRDLKISFGHTIEHSFPSEDVFTFIPVWISKETGKLRSKQKHVVVARDTEGTFEVETDECELISIEEDV